LRVFFCLYSLKQIFYFSFRIRLRNAYGTDWRNAARYTVAAVWDAHGWIWHGNAKFIWIWHFNLINIITHTHTHIYIYIYIYICQ